MYREYTYINMQNFKAHIVVVIAQFPFTAKTCF